MMQQIKLNTLAKGQVSKTVKKPTGLRNPSPLIATIGGGGVVGGAGAGGRGGFTKKTIGDSQKFPRNYGKSIIEKFKD